MWQADRKYFCPIQPSGSTTDQSNIYLSSTWYQYEESTPFMIYFNKDYIQFFKDLAANNNRDWFQANKDRYEKVVKKPFEVFVADMIRALARADKALVHTTPAECIFRINRDIRFSKDKTPYKLNASAVVAVGGRKNLNGAGIYFELGPEKVSLAGGAYMPDKDSLLRIREHISVRPKAFMTLLSDPKFEEKWGALQGERNKIIPAEFKKAALVCPHIANKQFYYWTELPVRLITSDKLKDTVLAYYQAARPVEKFISGALRT